MTWLLLLPAFVFLVVFAVCVLLADDDPQEPPPPETPRWKGGWRV